MKTVCNITCNITSNCVSFNDKNECDYRATRDYFTGKSGAYLDPGGAFGATEFPRAIFSKRNRVQVWTDLAAHESLYDFADTFLFSTSIKVILYEPKLVLFSTGYYGSARTLVALALQ